ncbi:attractin-like protein 1 isoform X1 [Misgurnus anguillicaudatus]|uniref:attractin-like protein 1 isoform X1 n=1 Tax=Misgurnus anguillicaudatus TaxID=75329 RepID=UPI003CCFA022
MHFCELIARERMPGRFRTALFTCMILYLLTCTDGAYSKTCDDNCIFGKCINATCVCHKGWVGDQCQHCQGRFRLTESSGSLTDGPVNYKYKTKCTWLIEGFPNAVLRLRFNHFATECSWDHMYVFDGDSIYAPLVAVFSGLVVPETKSNETIPEVVTTSGYATLHFFSDAAYNLTGFNILYSINSCPNNCSGHGRCSTSNSISSSVYCECERYWKGEACDIPYCSDDCGSPDRGYCDLTGEKLCVCNDSWQGPDCSLKVPSAQPYWFLPNVKPDGQSLGRASHKAVVHEKLMWVIGGFTFNYSSFQMVINYNLESSTWDVVPINSGPMARYGHSVALYKDDIFMFGGKLDGGAGNVTDELWVFNILSRSWSLRTPNSVAQAQHFAVEGHSAHTVDNRYGEPIMVVLFGYSPIYSYLSHVQEYNIRTNSWSITETNGALVQGGYGYSSVFDSTSHSIYVHGGYKALPANKYGLVDHLYRYQVHTRTWFILKQSGLARYLHSAVLISGVLLVFGGNTHNDTSLSNGAKCFSSDFLSYDIACDEWTVMPKPNLHRDMNRFGHTAVVSNGSMYVFGGFSGVILNDVLVYKPGSCEALLEVALCQNAGPGIRCVWVNERCVSWDSSYADGSVPASFCPTRSTDAGKQCHQFSDCTSCTANTNDCHWCEDKKCISSLSNCTVLTVELARHPRGPLYLNPPPAMLSEHHLSVWRPGIRRNGQSVKNFTKCSVRSEPVCSKLVNCKSCFLNINCQWDAQQQECHALPAQLCGEGWNQIGDACLRLNSSKDSYDNGQHNCKNLDGNIASLTSSRQVDFILEELQKYQAQGRKLTPWVGLRKINVSNWGWEDRSPFTASTLQWLPGEPSDSGFCAFLERAEVAGLKAKPCTANTEGLICQKPLVNPNLSMRSCKMPCALRTTCANCTSQAMECMWCGSTRRCVDSNAYVISFPYGQCLEWQTGDCGSQHCSGHRTCAQCLEQPECGWCGDPTDTGRGQCIEGSYRGPMRSLSRQSQEMVLDTSMCLREKGYDWSYITCPACQCNGHSTCVNGSVCDQCKNLTTGPQCQTCLPGYYGDASNGGKCQACRCNNHANVCHSSSGKCYCTTKGVKGDQCQLCDSENRYLGNPLRGTCYYNLLIDYQFTFSLLQDDDQHYTAINFMATPEETNKNLDVSINASNNFKLNITWSLGSTAGTISGEEFPIVSKTNSREYRDSFSCEKFSFIANPNITFHVYVSNFTWPIKIQISFSQHSSIMDLVQFFVTFFSCFLSLLLVAAVVWKVKQTCWASRRREQLMRERQQMASRPFASVIVALESPEEEEELLQGQVEADPIAVEPCAGGCAAVQTLLMSLPQGSSGVPPPGQCGITIASALIDTSQQRAGDFKDKSLNLKSRKQHHTMHQGTCV